MPHFVYILQSERDHKYYIGYTTDVEKRLAYHNSGRQRSTRFRTPFRLVLFEEFTTVQEALKREKQLKSYKCGEAFLKVIAGV